MLIDLVSPGVVTNPVSAMFSLALVGASVWWTAEQAASYLGISVRHFRKLTNQGLVRVTRVTSLGGRRCVRTRQEWLDSSLERMSSGAQESDANPVATGQASTVT